MCLPAKVSLLILRLRGHVYRRFGSRQGKQTNQDCLQRKLSDFWSDERKALIACSLLSTNLFQQMSSTFHPWSQFNHPETTVLEQLRTLKSVDILFKKFDRKFQDNQVDHGRQGWIFLVIREQLFPDNFFFSRRNIHFWEKYAPLSREEVDFVICNSNHLIPYISKEHLKRNNGIPFAWKTFPRL